MSSETRMPAVFLGHGSPMNVLETNKFTDAWRALGQSDSRSRGRSCRSPPTGT